MARVSRETGERLEQLENPQQDAATRNRQADKPADESQ